ncbi:MAG: selenocysteine-specific translation elongation factor [Planctomycetes bacterium]|nr:selenocysteine-specific translation elongation factor [Planctomycetota bacterium]
MATTTADSDRGILRVVVGTAGHIDHGKSTLVCRLTGIDPDRLPEEKARGLTIDLGFANFRLSNGWRVGIVDVPGHERFVHNMVAGATGIDLALLVVAADDGVKPQTIEHLEILQLLGIRRGIVVITKIDMVSADLRQLAEAEVAELVKGTFLEQAPRVAVSSKTGEGIDRLREQIETLALGLASRQAMGVFRMPIQRVFAAKGFGCVLTGIPLSGSLGIGDRVAVLPAGIEGTIRGLEAYHRSAERIAAGHSSALNVSGVAAESCRRGMVVATPGYFPSTHIADVRLTHPARRRRALKDRVEVRFHTGTSECGARLHLLDRTELAPGESALAQVLLEEPLVLAPGDRYLLRLPSPAETVGGGVILGRAVAKRRRRSPEELSDLAEAERALASLDEMVLVHLRRVGLEPARALELAVACDALESATAEALERLRAAGKAVKLRSIRWIGKDAWSAARARVDQASAEYFRLHPERLVFERLPLQEGTGLDAAVLEDVLADLARCGRLALEAGGGVRSAQRGPTLTPEQVELCRKIEARLDAAPFSPPPLPELQSALGAPKAAVDSMLKRLVDEKKIARIAPDLYFSAAAVARVREAVERNCAKHVAKGGDGELDLPSLRDELGTTRRWLIPLVEWLDATGFTTRLGPRRILKRRSAP